MSKVYLLNTLVIPVNFDTYDEAYIKMEKISVDEAKQILINNPFISAIGHEGTAKLLSQLLGIAIQINRISVFFEPGDIGIHFFLKQRLPEGKVLTEEELKELDFWLVKSELVYGSSKDDKDMEGKMSKEEEIKRNIETLWEKIWKGEIFVGDTFYNINTMDMRWVKITYETDRYIAELHFPNEIITITFNNKLEAVSFVDFIPASER